MNRWISLLVCVLFASRAGAEELNFFSASKAGPDAWSWGEAKIKKNGKVLHVEETNPEGDYGDVFVSDKFPYFPDGIVKIDVSQIYSGKYTLHILGFRGGAETFKADAIKNSDKLNIQTIKLADLNFPPETETILFKLWVAGAEGAALDLSELLYSKIVNLDTPLLNEDFKNTSHWQPEPTVSLAAESDGARLTLQPDQGFGCIAGSERVALKEDAELIFHATDVLNGTVTVQLEAFDETGEFIGPVDAIKEVGAGYHGVRFSTIKWPEGTAKVGVKIWLGGNEGASALLNQLLIY